MPACLSVLHISLKDISASLLENFPCLMDHSCFVADKAPPSYRVHESSGVGGGRKGSSCPLLQSTELGGRQKEALGLHLRAASSQQDIFLAPEIIQHG